MTSPSYIIHHTTTSYRSYNYNDRSFLLQPNRHDLSILSKPNGITFPSFCSYQLIVVNCKRIMSSFIHPSIDTIILSHCLLSCKMLSLFSSSRLITLTDLSHQWVAMCTVIRQSLRSITYTSVSRFCLT